jgi:hypothetical protein
MARACSRYGERRDAYTFLVENQEVKEKGG